MFRTKFYYKMEKSNMTHLSFNFESITSLYKGLSEKDLTLEVYQYGSDAVEIKLVNTNYQKQQKALKMQIVLFNLCLIGCTIFFVLAAIHFYIGIILLWFLVLLHRANHLVEYEKLIFCHDFGLHLQIKKYLGKHNRYIPAINIHDVVINEVLEDLDCRYLLILRTKGVLFHKKPIICIFEVFKPPYACLSLVYDHLNRVMTKKQCI